MYLFGDSPLAGGDDERAVWRESEEGMDVSHPPYIVEDNEKRPTAEPLAQPLRGLLGAVGSPIRIPTAYEKALQML
jgi:hypothetical protein